MKYIPTLPLVLGCLIAGTAPLRAQGDLRFREEQAIKKAVERVAPSVVRIETVGGLERVGGLLVGTGPTTGLVVSQDGYIISSAFNFVQKPDSILVTLPGGNRTPATLVATDHNRMLVLLKISSAEKLSVPQFVPEKDIRVGQWAIAVGRTFEGSGANLSVGIVSATNRIWSKAIQTDAKISPSNYGGPLVDISGRVLGVLVPLSIEASSEMAGVEWYDSGIGFAVPLEHVLRVLPRLAKGEDLRPGLMGISLSLADLFTEPAVIGASRPNSPAYKAGFQAGDVIVEAAGKKVSRQAELKHQLNSRYAGDKIKIVAMRKDQRIEREIELVAKLEPYEFPFLGILPVRPIDGHGKDVVVRFVYSGGPAAVAGIQMGDRITALQGQQVQTAAQIAEKLRTAAPDEKVRLEIMRNDKVLSLEVQLGRLPSDIPAELPPAHASVEAPAGERPQVGVVSLKVPEFENQCVAYVPSTYHPGLSYGVVVWLHSPGAFDQVELLQRWQAHCDEHDLILLAPKAADPTKWLPAESKFIRRVLDDVMKTYHVDPARIVVHGHEAGGSLAFLVGFANSDVVRAIVAVEAPLPLLVQPPETDPVRPIAVFMARSADSVASPQIEATLKRLRELKHPLTEKSTGEQARYLTPDELAELVRWIDALDRL